jgi:hypothetical protein
MLMVVIKTEVMVQWEVQRRRLEGTLNTFVVASAMLRSCIY